MKKYLTITCAATLLLSSCGSADSSTAAGGFMGAQLGSILGSAIGGISGGPRGSDIGTIVGMAGAAMVGAIAGNAADKANNKQRQYEDIQSYDNNIAYNNSDSGFDPNNGGDDIIDFGSPTTPQTPVPSIHLNHEQEEINLSKLNNIKALEIRNVNFVNSKHGQALYRGDLAQIVVEIYNNSNSNIYNVEPMVIEATGNKHIYVSNPIRVEKIAPGMGIRYTAMVKADNRLKNGNAQFLVAVNDNNSSQHQDTKELNIATYK